MNTVGPIALMARVKAGLTTPALKSVLVAGDNALVSLLLPVCDYEDLTGLGFFRWVCTAYDGNIGVAKMITNSENMATANTSRAVAQSALVTLAATP
jgi:hypothetical protein